MDEYKAVSAARWRGLALADYVQLLGAGEPLDQLLGHPHSVIKDYGPVTTYAVELPQGAVIVRHDRRSRPRWFSTRSMHTLRIHRRLRSAGIAVPRVVAALRHYDAEGRLEELVITEKLDATDFMHFVHSRDPANRFQVPDVARLAELLLEAGRLFRRVHDAGFIHGDPIPGNMMVGRDGELALIDNERTRHLGNLPLIFAHKRRDNLMRLLSRALLTRHGYRLARKVLVGYYGTAHPPRGSRIRNEWHAIARRARRRRRWLLRLHRHHRFAPWIRVGRLIG